MLRDKASTEVELIPAAAREEWQRLRELLHEIVGVPCRDGDPEAWWPIRAPLGRAALAAVDACRGCPAQAPCRAYALAADERYGIWGATTPEERRAMRWLR